MPGEHLTSRFSLLSAPAEHNGRAFGRAEGAHAMGEASSGLDCDGFVDREATINHVGSLQTSSKDENG